LNNIELSNDNVLRAKLGSLDTTASDSSNEMHPNKKTYKYNWLKVAVPIILLVGLVFLVVNNSGVNNQVMNNEHVFAEHYKIIPAEVNQRGGSSQSNEKFQEAMIKYASKDYKAALNLLENLGNSSSKIKLYKAICNIELDQFENAKSYLDDVSKSLNSEDQQNAEWYIALLYLKQSNLTSSKETLNRIVQQPDHLFVLKAKALIKELG